MPLARDRVGSGSQCRQRFEHYSQHIRYAARGLPSRGIGIGIGIGQGDLPVMSLVQGPFYRQNLFSLAANTVISSGQTGGTFRADRVGFLTVDVRSASSI